MYRRAHNSGFLHVHGGSRRLLQGGTLAPAPLFAPTITSSSITGTPEDGQMLTAQRAANGNPAPTYAYQWQVNGVNISGQTAQTITLDEAGMGLADGDTISCEITATNSEGSDTAEPTIAYVYVAPPDVTAPTITSANPSDAYDQSSTVSGTLTADETVTWSKSGTDAAKLTLDTSTGVWSLDTSALGSLAITVTATDGAGNASSQTWNFSIVAVATGLATPVLTWTSADIAYDPTFTMTEITEGDVAELQIDDNSDFSSLYGSDTNTIDAIEGASGEITFPAIPTLATGTTYYARARYTRGADTSSWSATVSKAMAADTTAPTLSSPTDTANGSTGATLSVSTNEGNGTLYWYISASATPPSATNLKAGTGATSFGSQTVTASGVQNVSATGLTASTAYYAHFLHRDAAGNDSTIVSGDGFSTGAAATLPTSGLILRLEADDAATVFQSVAGTTAAADGQPVGYWGDKSGAGFHMTAAADDTTRPTYRANSGLPYIEFDGSNDILRRLAGLGLFASGTGFTVIAAMDAPTTQAGNNLAVFMEGNSAENNSVHEIGTASTTNGSLSLFHRTSAGTTTNVSFYSEFSDNTPRVLTVTDNGAGSTTGYRDGTAGTPVSYTRGTLTLNRFSLGGWQRATPASYMAIKIYAFAAWNRVLNSTELAQALTYMGTKQGRSL